MTEQKEKTEMILYKILILGNSSVGKTSFLIRFCDDKFGSDTLTTVGVDYKKKFIKKNGQKIKLHICDTAGQERFRAIAKNLYKNADGIILMYDISNKKSFKDIKDWIISIKDNIDFNKIGLVIVGNKIDLKNEREIDEEMRQDLEKKENIKVLEASAKDNINVNDVFIELIDRMEKLNLGAKHQSSYDDDNDEEEDNPEKQTIKLKNNDMPKNSNNNNNNCCLKKKKQK